ncbi:hypothetical protein PV08_05881 [Exophiala spinifera]|uniref:Uncharacterized protein n=1 Tax=Exophiala spinifera TaxID=91928 RepID=A0A0D1YLB4_9EURO|nr:uncharacterized protein PV08_05881 [Exophiala spinifera]KIW15831.1 hypothetical protein PV08_05881 [Exophiala spinifera]
MPSASPSPMKRPSLNERTLSTQSLSSSGKQATGHKVHRPQKVTRHSRNVSHGKGLSKLGRNHSTAAILTDHHHHRKKSSGTTPPQSPKTPLVKRNSSHAALPKNQSHGNLRKNQSANALARNLSHPALKKIGLAPAPKQKTKKKDGVFQLGDHSSDEEEAEWEDSNTQSPEMTRNNSKTSTPLKVGTPDDEEVTDNGMEASMARHTRRTSSPPAPSLRTNNRSAPNLRKDSNMSPPQLAPDPALLHQQHRASRAPPAMSTVSALAGPSQLLRSESSKSFTHITHGEAASTHTLPGMSGSGQAAASSSADGGVSHFLSESAAPSRQQVIDESDDDSPSTFMDNYKPQPSESPEKTRTLHKVRLPTHPSRTQQKLELQRREIMRASAATPTTPPAHGMGLSIGSSTSLHSRTSSRNRNRSLAGGRGLAGDLKAIQKDYESAVKQITVVRKFRSPIIESMLRLKEDNALPAELGQGSSAIPTSKSRPASRRGPGTTTINGRSLEDKKPALVSRSSHRTSQSGRVHFQRQSSHENIGVTPSQGSPDDDGRDDEHGLSPEEALLRRIWESRGFYEAGDVAPPSR